MISPGKHRGILWQIPAINNEPAHSVMLGEGTTGEGPPDEARRGTFKKGLFPPGDAFLRRLTT